MRCIYALIKRLIKGESNQQFKTTSKVITHFNALSQMKYIYFLALLCPILCIGQQPNTGLSVGDKVPPVILKNIINHPQASAQLSSYNDKLIILDFWATWCAPCIKELPKLESLQKHFAGKVQVLVIAYEPTQTVKAFIKSNKVAASVALPFVTADTLLSKLFPHNTVPHQVWLYDGYVKAITDVGYTTVKNLRAVLEGKHINLPVKKDFIGFNKKLPLLQNGNGGGEEDIISRSLFTNHLSGVKEGYGNVVSNGTKRIYAINLPVLSLYNVAIGKRINNRVVLETNDSARFINNTHLTGEWDVNNTFSYELTVPALRSKEESNAIILQDINRALNLYGRMEKRLVKCWALTALDTAKFQTKGGSPQFSLATSDEPYTVLKNKSLTSLIEALNHHVPGYPLRPIVVDETNYTRGVDIHLNAPLDDLPGLKNELLRFGLDLIPVHRQLELLVITDSHNQAVSGGIYKLPPTVNQPTDPQINKLNPPSNSNFKF